MLDLTIRNKGIGGSEVAAILGLDEYSSPYKVWLSKTGRESSNVDNKYTQAGIILEDAVSKFFESKTDYRIIKASAKSETLIHPKYPFAFGTPDRRYFRSTSVGKGILECKTTQHAYDDVPQKWFIQLQWYLGIVGYNFGSVAWLERGLDFKYKEFEYDPQFFEYLVQAAERFWTENVVKDVPPEAIDVNDIQLMYRKHTDGVVVEASEEMAAAYEELVRVRTAIKTLDEEKNKLEDAIKFTMREAESVMSKGKPLFTWKSSKASTKFDVDSFKADHPDLFSAYLKEIEGSRRFLVK